MEIRNNFPKRTTKLKDLLSKVKAYHKATAIETVHKHIDQWSETEINRPTHIWSIQQKVLEQSDIHMQRNEAKPTPLYIQKWIRPKIVTFLKKTGESLCDFYIGKDFLHSTIYGIKTDELDFIKIKNIFSLKDTSKKMK